MNRQPKIVIDDKIPFIKGVFEACAEVLYLPANEIDANVVHDADALIVRTRTQCNEQLLAGSSVKLIVTATIGYDHIDTAYCERNGIAWANAPGCNANSVAQYIGSVLANYAKCYDKDLMQLTLGIVGVGHVGTQVWQLATQLGMRVLLNDPIRQQCEPEMPFVSLETLAEQADVITFHMPLTYEGEFATHNLADAEFFAQCQRKPLIINAARGGVVNERALLKAKYAGKISAYALDCWEKEPHISVDMLENAFVATPHIAGYSADGKANATQMSVRAVSRFFGLGFDDFAVTDLSAQHCVACQRRELPTKILQNYDVMCDDALLREHPDNFEKLRGNYRIRREEKYEVN